MSNWPLPPHTKSRNWVMSVAVSLLLLFFFFWFKILKIANEVQEHAEKKVPLPVMDYDKLPTNYKMWWVSFWNSP